MVLMALTLAWGACTPTPSPSAAPSALGTPLPQVANPEGPCAGQGLSQFRVRADPDDPRLVWFELEDTGQRVNINWPPGFGVRFEPVTQVLDAQGAVVLTAYQFVSSAPMCTGRGLTLNWPNAD